MSKQQKRNLKVNLTLPTRWALAKVGGREVMEMLRESLDRSRDNPTPSELIPVSWPCLGGCTPAFLCLKRNVCAGPSLVAKTHVLALMVWEEIVARTRC